MVMTPPPVGVNPWQRFKGRANNKGLEQDNVRNLRRMPRHQSDPNI